MHVYESVKAYLDSRGIRQVTIAEKTGIVAQSLNEILNGKRTMYADEFKAICIALNVSPEVFIHIEPDSEVKKYKLKTNEELIEDISIIEEYLKGSLLEEQLYENTFISNQIALREKGKMYEISDHIRGIVYAYLSSGVRWGALMELEKAEDKTIPLIDEVFFSLEFTLQVQR